MAIYHVTFIYGVDVEADSEEEAVEIASTSLDERQQDPQEAIAIVRALEPDDCYKTEG